MHILLWTIEQILNVYPYHSCKKKSNDIYVYFGSQEELNVGGNVNFGLQKYMYTKLFNNSRILYKNDFEGQLTTHWCQNGEWHCFG